MKTIKCLAEQVREELDDSKEYAKLAIQYKAEEPKLASVYAELAQQEMQHSTMLHEQAVRIIGSHAGEVPEAMKIVWDWEHERMIDCMTAIKVLLDVYRK